MRVGRRLEGRRRGGSEEGASIAQSTWLRRVLGIVTCGVDQLESSLCSQRRVHA